MTKGKPSYKYRFHPIIRIIAASLTIAFLAQDIVWAYPDSFHHNPRFQNNKLATEPFSRDKASQPRFLSKYLEDLIEGNRIFRLNPNVDAIEAILIKAAREDEVGILRNDMTHKKYSSEILITSRLMPGLMLRYYDPVVPGLRDKYADKRISEEVIQKGERAVLHKELVRVEELGGPQGKEAPPKRRTKRGRGTRGSGPPQRMALRRNGGLYVLTQADGTARVFSTLWNVFRSINHQIDTEMARLRKPETRARREDIRGIVDNLIRFRDNVVMNEVRTRNEGILRMIENSQVNGLSRARYMNLEPEFRYIFGWLIGPLLTKEATPDRTLVVKANLDKFRVLGVERSNIVYGFLVRYRRAVETAELADPSQAIDREKIFRKEFYEYCLENDSTRNELSLCWTILYRSAFFSFSGSGTDEVKGLFSAATDWALLQELDYSNKLPRRLPGKVTALIGEIKEGGRTNFAALSDTDKDNLLAALGDAYKLGEGDRRLLDKAAYRKMVDEGPEGVPPILGGWPRPQGDGRLERLLQEAENALAQFEVNYEEALRKLVEIIKTAPYPELARQIDISEVARLLDKTIAHIKPDTDKNELLFKQIAEAYVFFIGYSFSNEDYEGVELYLSSLYGLCSWCDSGMSGNGPEAVTRPHEFAIGLIKKLVDSFDEAGFRGLREWSKLREMISRLLLIMASQYYTKMDIDNASYALQDYYLLKPTKIGGVDFGSLRTFVAGKIEEIIEFRLRKGRKLAGAEIEVERLFRDEAMELLKDAGSATSILECVRIVRSRLKSASPVNMYMADGALGMILGILINATQREGEDSEDIRSLPVAIKEILKGLGEAYLKSGEKEKAKEYLYKALSIDQSDPETERLILKAEGAGLGVSADFRGPPFGPGATVGSPIMGPWIAGVRRWAERMMRRQAQISSESEETDIISDDEQGIEEIRRKLPAEGQKLIFIFDIHGVLLKANWHRVYEIAYCELTGATKTTAKEWVRDNVVGKSDEAAIKALSVISEKPPEIVARVLEESRDFVASRETPKAMPGAKEFLKALCDSKIRFAAITGSKKDDAIRQLKDAGLGDLIPKDRIMGDVSGKSRADLLKGIQEKYPDCAIIYFDDWEDMFKESAGLDIISFGIPQSSGPEKEKNKESLKNAGVNYILNNGFEDWPEILKLLTRNALYRTTLYHYSADLDGSRLEAMGRRLAGPDFKLGMNDAVITELAEGEKLTIDELGYSSFVIRGKKKEGGYIYVLDNILLTGKIDYIRRLAVILSRMDLEEIEINFRGSSQEIRDMPQYLAALKGKDIKIIHEDAKDLWAFKYKSRVALDVHGFSYSYNEGLVPRKPIEHTWRGIKSRPYPLLTLQSDESDESEGDGCICQGDKALSQLVKGLQGPGTSDVTKDKTVGIDINKVEEKLGMNIERRLGLDEGKLRILLTDEVVISDEDFVFGFYSDAPPIKEKLIGILGEKAFNDLFKTPTLVLTRGIMSNPDPLIRREYLYHEIICNMLGHEEAIFMQQKKFGGNYKDGDFEEDETGKYKIGHKGDRKNSFKGALGRAIAGRIRRALLFLIIDRQKDRETRKFENIIIYHFNQPDIKQPNFVIIEDENDPEKTYSVSSLYVELLKKVSEGADKDKFRIVFKEKYNAIFVRADISIDEMSKLVRSALSVFIIDMAPPLPSSPAPPAPATSPAVIKKSRDFKSPVIPPAEQPKEKTNSPITEADVGRFCQTFELIARGISVLEGAPRWMEDTCNRLAEAREILFREHREWCNRLAKSISTPGDGGDKYKDLVAEILSSLDFVKLVPLEETKPADKREGAGAKTAQQGTMGDTAEAREAMVAVQRIIDKGGGINEADIEPIRNAVDIGCLDHDQINTLISAVGRMVNDPLIRERRPGLASRLTTLQGILWAAKSTTGNAGISHVSRAASTVVPASAEKPKPEAPEQIVAGTDEEFIYSLARIIEKAQEKKSQVTLNRFDRTRLLNLRPESLRDEPLQKLRHIAAYFAVAKSRLGTYEKVTLNTKEQPSREKKVTVDLAYLQSRIEDEVISRRMQSRIAGGGAIGKFYDSPDPALRRLVTEGIHAKRKGKLLVLYGEGDKALYTKDGNQARVEPISTIRSRGTGSCSLVIIKDNRYIGGFFDAGEDTAYITEFLFNNQIARYHETGEGQYATRRGDLPPGLNAHKLLRGAGKRLRNLILDAAERGELTGDFEKEDLIAFINRADNREKLRYTDQDIAGEIALIEYNASRGNRGIWLILGDQDIELGLERNSDLTLSLILNELVIGYREEVDEDSSTYEECIVPALLASSRNDSEDLKAKDDIVKDLIRRYGNPFYDIQDYQRNFIPLLIGASRTAEELKKKAKLFERWSKIPVSATVGGRLYFGDKIDDAARDRIITVADAFNLSYAEEERGGLCVLLPKGVPHYSLLSDFITNFMEIADVPPGEYELELSMGDRLPRDASYIAASFLMCFGLHRIEDALGSPDSIVRGGDFTPMEFGIDSTGLMLGSVNRNSEIRSIIDKREGVTVTLGNEDPKKFLTSEIRCWQLLGYALQASADEITDGGVALAWLEFKREFAGILQRYGLWDDFLSDSWVRRLAVNKVLPIPIIDLVMETQSCVERAMNKIENAILAEEKIETTDVASSERRNLESLWRYILRKAEEIGSEGTAEHLVRQAIEVLLNMVSERVKVEMGGKSAYLAERRTFAIAYHMVIMIGLHNTYVARELLWFVVRKIAKKNERLAAKELLHRIFPDEEPPADNDGELSPLIGKYVPTTEIEFVEKSTGSEEGYLQFKAYSIDDPDKKEVEIKIGAKMDNTALFYQNFRHTNIRKIDGPMRLKALEMFGKKKVFILEPNEYGIYGIGTRDVLAISDALKDNRIALFHELAHATGITVWDCATGADGHVGTAWLRDFSKYKKREGKAHRLDQAMQQHYALRLFQRKMWPEEDLELTHMIKGIPKAADIETEDMPLSKPGRPRILKRSSNISPRANRYEDPETANPIQAKRMLSWLITRPADFNWENEAKKLPSLDGKTFGQTDPGGIVILDPKRQLSWKMPEIKEAGWETSVTDSGVKREESGKFSYQFTVLFSKKDKEPFQMIFRIGPGRRTCSRKGLSTIEIFDIELLKQIELPRRSPKPVNMGYHVLRTAIEQLITDYCKGGLDKELILDDLKNFRVPLKTKLKALKELLAKYDGDIRKTVLIKYLIKELEAPKTTRPKRRIWTTEDSGSDLKTGSSSNVRIATFFSLAFLLTFFFDQSLKTTAFLLNYFGYINDHRSLLGLVYQFDGEPTVDLEWASGKILTVIIMLVCVLYLKHKNKFHRDKINRVIKYLWEWTEVLTGIFLGSMSSNGFNIALTGGVINTFSYRITWMEKGQMWEQWIYENLTDRLQEFWPAVIFSAILMIVISLVSFWIRSVKSKRTSFIRLASEDEKRAAGSNGTPSPGSTDMPGYFARQMAGPAPMSSVRRDTVPTATGSVSMDKMSSAASDQAPAIGPIRYGDAIYKVVKDNQGWCLVAVNLINGHEKIKTRLPLENLSYLAQTGEVLYLLDNNNGKWYLVAVNLQFSTAGRIGVLPVKNPSYRGRVDDIVYLKDKDGDEVYLVEVDLKSGRGKRKKRLSTRAKSRDGSNLEARPVPESAADGKSGLVVRPALPLQKFFEEYRGEVYYPAGGIDMLSLSWLIQTFPNVTDYVFRDGFDMDESGRPLTTPMKISEIASLIEKRIRERSCLSRYIERVDVNPNGENLIDITVKFKDSSKYAGKTINIRYEIGDLFENDAVYGVVYVQEPDFAGHLSRMKRFWDKVDSNTEDGGVILVSDHGTYPAQLAGVSLLTKIERTSDKVEVYVKGRQPDSVSASDLIIRPALPDEIEKAGPNATPQRNDKELEDHMQAVGKMVAPKDYIDTSNWREALSWLITRPRDFNWEKEADRLPVLNMVEIGRIPTAGYLTFTPVTGYKFVWRIFRPDKSSNCNAVIVSGGVKDRYYQFTVKFTEGNNSLTKVFRIGPERRFASPAYRRKKDDRNDMGVFDIVLLEDTIEEASSAAPASLTRIFVNSRPQATRIEGGHEEEGGEGIKFIDLIIKVSNTHLSTTEWLECLDEAVEFLTDNRDTITDIIGKTKMLRKAFDIISARRIKEGIESEEMAMIVRMREILDELMVATGKTRAKAGAKRDTGSKMAPEEPSPGSNNLLDSSCAFAIIKPDRYKRRSEIKEDLRRAGFEINSVEIKQLPKVLAEQLYAEHKEKSFFPRLVSYLCEGPIEVLLLRSRGERPAWDKLRTIVIKDAGDGTHKSLRDKYGIEEVRFTDGTKVTKNGIHCSDSLENMRREAGLFIEDYPDLQIVEDLYRQLDETSRLLAARIMSLSPEGKDRTKVDADQRVIVLRAQVDDLQQRIEAMTRAHLLSRPDVLHGEGGGMVPGDDVPNILRYNSDEKRDTATTAPRVIEEKSFNLDSHSGDYSSQIHKIKKNIGGLLVRYNFRNDEADAAISLSHELVSNMLEYGKGGKFILRILERADGAVLLEITGRDNGPGIQNPEDERLRSFGRLPGDGLGFHAFTHAGDEVIIESLGKRWVRNTWWSFEEKGASAVNKGTLTTILIYRRGRNGEITKLDKVQGVSDSEARPVPALDTAKYSSATEMMEDLLRGKDVSDDQMLDDMKTFAAHIDRVGIKPEHRAIDIGACINYSTSLVLALYGCEVDFVDPDEEETGDEYMRNVTDTLRMLLDNDQKAMARVISRIHVHREYLKDFLGRNPDYRYDLAVYANTFDLIIGREGRSTKGDDIRLFWRSLSEGAVVITAMSTYMDEFMNSGRMNGLSLRAEQSPERYYFFTPLFGGFKGSNYTIFVEGHDLQRQLDQAKLLLDQRMCSLRAEGKKVDEINRDTEINALCARVDELQNRIGEGGVEIKHAAPTVGTSSWMGDSFDLGGTGPMMAEPSDAGTLERMVRDETTIPAGRNVRSELGSEPRFINSLHVLATAQGDNTRFVPRGAQILLSETLFDPIDADHLKKLIRSRLGEDSPVKIVTAREARGASTNAKASKEKLACVISQNDYDDPDLWGGNHKMQNRASLLILKEDLQGSRYLYLEGVVGLAGALMSNDMNRVRTYFSLIFEKTEAVGDMAIGALLEIMVKDPRQFTNYIRFRPIVPFNDDLLDSYKVKVEDFLIAA